MGFSGNFVSVGLRLAVKVISSTRATLIAAAVLLVSSVTPALAQDGNLTPKAEAAAQYHALFHSWKKLDQISTGAGESAISIPSILPITNYVFTSAFGVRSDPFRGSAAMHAGVDLSAAHGSPIYATADGVVDRAEWFGGYGNMVEIDHGKGIATRYGHMSRIAAKSGETVKRGDLIGYVGSTGRSTGPHLHYEVRIDGQAVNPIPYMVESEAQLAYARDGRLTGQGGQ
jgi:murein DD-endopeptidase MepM/ murein hydrolase activator NlpD